MATPCAGVTATWNGVAFGELTDIKVNFGGEFAAGRTSAFAVDKGSIEIACLGTSNVSVSEYGRKATLAIGGGGMTFSHKAVYLGFTLTGKVNDVSRASVTLKLIGE